MGMASDIFWMPRFLIKNVGDEQNLNFSQMLTNACGSENQARLPNQIY